MTDLNSNHLSPLWSKDDGAFAEDMNSFCSRFDKHDFRSVIDDIISSTKTGGNICIEDKDVLRVFQCTNVRKSPGPDGISGQVLKNCATQLSGIFHSIFLLAYRKSLPYGKRLWACKWVMIHGKTPRDWSRLRTGHKNNIIMMEDSCSFRLLNTRKIRLQISRVILFLS